ncbi:MAG TPA: hypothetical protein VFP50_00700 [Anaeromyxobacteraceae bacterium]|nr:hypothetical protein [Anaeromyxobacteraceae bacterium]
MPLTSAILMSLALAAGPERLLLCRPAVGGDPALARADAVTDAGRQLGGSFLDYGVPCETSGEASRAAARAALSHGVFASAEGRIDGSAYLLVLAAPGQQEEELARRELLVPPGVDPVGPIRAALSDLERAVPRQPPRWTGVAGWALVGAGAAAVAAGTLLALAASDDARRADGATTPADYPAADRAYRSKHTASGAALGAGATALAAGLVLRFAF